MNDSELVCVDPKKVDEVWPHIYLMLERALMRGTSDDTMSALKHELDEAKAVLWVIWNRRVICGAVVTSIVQAPTKKFCLISAVGGDDLKDWIHHLGKIETYAKAEGCESFRLYGRHGWKRIMSDWHEPYIVLEKALV